MSELIKKIFKNYGLICLQELIKISISQFIQENDLNKFSSGFFNCNVKELVDDFKSLIYWECNFLNKEDIYRLDYIMKIIRYWH